MLLAELEVRHSRAVAPTRRVALGPLWLPTDPAPGYGGVLLGGVVAANLADVDPEAREELMKLLDDLESGQRIPQPRLRYRFQTDVVGLERSRFALVSGGRGVRYEMAARGRPVAQILGAAYAAGTLHASVRAPVFTAMRKAARWDGAVGPDLVRHLSDPSAAPPRRWLQFPTDERWALQVLGFGPGGPPDRDAVQRRFRTLVRQAHPDHGAQPEGAGQRMLELTEARRILLA